MWHCDQIIRQLVLWHFILILRMPQLYSAVLIPVTMSRSINSKFVTSAFLSDNKVKQTKIILYTRTFFYTYFSIKKSQSTVDLTNPNITDLRFNKY